MNKKWLRRILAMAMVFSLAAGSWVTGYADDGEGNIVISGDGVYEVEAGKTTKIELQVKKQRNGDGGKCEPSAESAFGRCAVSRKDAGQRRPWRHGRKCL